MHIPNAMLDPRVAAATCVIGASALGFALRRMERRLGGRSPVLMGTMAAFVFAAQMVNFPVGPGVSGHLLGGVLASVVLGPWAGAVVVAAVLIVQCLMFGDGGLMALGANFINMGLLGSVVGHAIYAPVRSKLGGRPGVIIGAMAAAWFTVLLAAGAFTLELAPSVQSSEFPRILAWMILVHAGIGVGEALITGLVLKFILLTRPDLVYDPEDGLKNHEGEASYGWAGASLAGLAVALAVCVVLAPLASEHPDGLEYLGQRFGFMPEDASPSLPVPVPDYLLPIPGLRSLGAATATAGVLGTLLVFGFALTLGRAVSGKHELTVDGLDPAEADRGLARIEAGVHPDAV